MKIIVGLGNPGKKYENTRHNIGFAVLDKLQTETVNLQFSSSKQTPIFKFSNKFKSEVLEVNNLLLVKPQNFMNRSGEVVSKIVSFYKIDLNDLLVAHDDLDIKLGEYKIQKEKGPKDHKGILSVEQIVGKNFWRVRIGVDNRGTKSTGSTKGTKSKILSGEDYVLMKFTAEEQGIVNRVIDDVVEELLVRLKADG